MSAAADQGPPGRESGPAADRPAEKISPTKIKHSLRPVAIEGIAVDPRGRAWLWVTCPWCGALHRHSAAGRLRRVWAPCAGGRYDVTTAAVPHGAPIRAVQCRLYADELCLSCGPDADRLLADPHRLIGLTAVSA